MVIDLSSPILTSFKHLFIFYMTLQSKVSSISLKIVLDYGTKIKKNHLKFVIKILIPNFYTFKLK